MKHSPFATITRQFAKAQASSLIATGCDFCTTALVFRAMPDHVAWSTFLGALTGGIVNCTINYYWTFRGSRQRRSVVLLRYTEVWTGSILLNTWGTVWGVRLATQWVPEGLNVLLIVKATVAVIVAVCWNFLLQKLYVYRKRNLNS